MATKAKKVKKSTSAPKHHKGVDDHSFIIIAGGAVVIILLGLFTFSDTFTGMKSKYTGTVVMKEAVSENTVQIGETLMPESLTVKSGTEVTFMNNDAKSHRVMTADGYFDSKELMTGEKASYTFDTPGEYMYSVDDGLMQGTVIVE